MIDCNNKKLNINNFIIPNLFRGSRKYQHDYHPLKRHLNLKHIKFMCYHTQEPSS